MKGVLLNGERYLNRDFSVMRGQAADDICVSRAEDFGGNVDFDLRYPVLDQERCS